MVIVASKMDTSTERIIKYLKTGYVGVGKVIGEIQRAKDVRFTVDGKQVGFAELPAKGDYLYSSEDADNDEYVVKIEWIKTVSEPDAEKELGFFGNQNTVCRPKVPRWDYTVERLKEYGILIFDERS